MIQRIVLAVVVAVAVTLACILVGSILIALKVAVAVTVGAFLKDWAGVLGLLVGLWWFFVGGSFRWGQRS